MSPFEWVLVEDVQWFVNLIRWANMGLWLVTGALLLSLFRSNRTGRMGWKAAYGSVGAFWTIALAQPVAVARADADLNLIPVLVFVFGVLSLLGAWEPMEITLFKPKETDGP